MEDVSQIIRRKFHGFSDEQWEELKDTFPYSEIPFIVEEAIKRQEPQIESIRCNKCGNSCRFHTD